MTGLCIGQDLCVHVVLMPLKIVIAHEFSFAFAAAKAATIGVSVVVSLFI